MTGGPSSRDRLGDYSTDRPILLLTSMAAAVGVISAFVALALVRLIGLFTNLAYFHRFATPLTPPAASGLGLWAVPIPAIGGVIVGLMARYGSDRIRGHGIPEALEAILIGRSRIGSEGGGVEAVILGHRDRHGRSVRRGGTDHRHRRRVRVAVRASVPPVSRGAEDAARPGSRGRHDGDLCHAGDGGPPGHPAAAVRVQAPQLYPRRLLGGRGGRAARAAVRPRSAVPRHAAQRASLDDASRLPRVGPRRRARGDGDLGAPIRLRGSVRATADPLDVVARDRRSVRGPARTDLAPRAGRGLRGHARSARRTAAGRHAGGLGSRPG